MKRFLGWLASGGISDNPIELASDDELEEDSSIIMPGYEPHRLGAMGENTPY